MKLKYKDVWNWKITLPENYQQVCSWKLMRMQDDFFSCLLLLSFREGKIWPSENDPKVFNYFYFFKKKNQPQVPPVQKSTEMETYLEPKWPVFWLEKAFFWTGQPSKQRTNRFPVYIYIFIYI